VPFAASQGSIIYVKDLVTILLTVLRAPKLPHRLYDVVTEPRSKAQAAAIVQKLLPDAKIEIDLHGAFGQERPPERMTERAWQNSLLTRDFGFREAYSYEAAITDYIRMAQAGRFSW
jgi:nucleoside-diphosphate-sugar epimerase